MEINNLIESKIFISLISLFFGIFVYWFYLYIKHLQEKYDFSDELREIVNHYLKNGAITLREYGALVRIMAQMGNYLGIYREHEVFQKFRHFLFFKNSLRLTIKLVFFLFQD